MRGRSSEVGKVELGPHVRGKENSCSKKGYTSPLVKGSSLRLTLVYENAGSP
jgi:hypothetical protein